MGTMDAENHQTIESSHWQKQAEKAATGSLQVISAGMCIHVDVLILNHGNKLLLYFCYDMNEYWPQSCVFVLML